MQQTQNLVQIVMNQLSNLNLESKALLFKTNGNIQTIKPKGKYFTLYELQSLVKGYIEVHPERINNNLIVVNEEGLLNESLYNYTFKRLTGIDIWGDCLVCPMSIFEPDDDLDFEDF